MLRRWVGLIIVFGCLAVSMSRDVLADPATDYARPLPQSGVTELLGEYLPLDQGFLNEKEQIVKLGDYFREGRPVILSMNYSKCPLLCGTQLSGMVNTFDAMTFRAGQDFVVVSVSLDPNESVVDTKVSKQRYLQMDQHAVGEDSWNFLAGRSTGITRLANALGIKYEFVASRQEYAHPAVFIIATPEGYISRYVYGVNYDATTLQSWLDDARAGKIATKAESESAFNFVMSCFYYDASVGVYTAEAWIVLRVGVVLFVCCAAGLAWYSHRLIKLTQARQKMRSREILPNNVSVFDSTTVSAPR